MADTPAKSPPLAELVKPVIEVLKKVTGENPEPLTVTDQAVAAEFLKVYAVLTGPAPVPKA
jgi:hypothetical protein